MSGPEAEDWLARQEKNSRGKVVIGLVIAEGRRRGYCICPKPLRQVINMEGFTCAWCGMPETRQSWDFWYGEAGK